MTEEIKYVISEINSKLGSDYNLISFNSLSQTGILHLLNKVLNHFGICSLVNAEDNEELLIFIILESLQKIKYVPPADTTPEAFREGLVTGNLKVIVPVLSWLLKNEKDVTRRAYLSKFVEKIEVPLEMLGDPDVQATYQQYEAIIEEFWKTYSAHKKEKKNEEETNELKRDIERMDYDLSKLIQRTNQQKEKVVNIPNSESLLIHAKAYTKEVMQEKKLQEQLKSQQAALEHIENQIKVLNESISVRKISGPIKNRPVEHLENEFQTNKLLAEEELPKEYEKLNLELSLHETVFNEPEPTEKEISLLSNEVEKLQLELQNLNEKKLSMIHLNNDVLRPYQNQASMVANKKRELTTTVMELKENLNRINEELTEKQKKLISYVGGPVLHGEELRNYVSKLREISAVYKEKRAELQGLSNELGVVSRTFEVLNLIDPSIQKELEEKQENNHEMNVEGDEKALKTKLVQLMQDTSKKQAEAMQTKEELLAVKNELQVLEENYNEVKENFERSTGYAVDELKELQNEIATFENEIQRQEEKWKSLRREIERKEELLLRLSEDVINSVDDDDEHDKEPTQLEKLTKRLQEKEKRKRELLKERQNLSNKKEETQEQLEIMNGIIQIINCKQRLLGK